MLLSVVMTYPFVFQMTNEVKDPYDSLFTIWTISHELRQLTQDPLRLFDGNIFWPHRDTLALSEHGLGATLLVAPIYVVSGNPVLAYNAGILLTFILSGFAVFLLVRDLTGEWSASFLAGLLFAFSLYRLNQMSHLQYLGTQWLP